MKNIILSIIVAISCGILSGCNDELDRRTTLTFVGDSLIARWDLQQYFSSFVTTNMGKSGAGLDYIFSLKGTMTGRNIVVMIGTNNSYEMTAGKREAYAERYIEAILALNADTVYLYSVLPRYCSGDAPNINDNIKAFNEIVKLKVAEYRHIAYIEVYDEFIGDYHGINPQYYNDGLHLSFAGYEILHNKLTDLL